MVLLLPPHLAEITPSNAGRLALLAEFPHQWGTNGVAFSPDGQLVVSGQTTLQMWRLSDGQRERVWQAGDGVIQDVTFRPDGLAIATADSDHTVRVWDLQIGIPLRVLRSHRTLLYSLAFSPDGLRLAAGSGNFAGQPMHENVVQVWDARTDWRSTILNEPRDQVCVAFSPDGSTLAAGEEDGGIWIWDTETYDCLRYLETPGAAAQGNEGIARLAFSPDSLVLAAAGHSGLSPQGGAIFLWYVSAGQLLGVLADDSEDVWGIAYNPAGTLIASGGLEAVHRPSAVRLWSAHSGSLLAVLEGHQKPIESVTFSPDGRLIASGGGDGVLIWGVRE